MKRWTDVRGVALAAVLLAVCVGATSGAALAQDARPAATAGASAGAGAANDADHRRDDVVRHRTIAAAHEAAARCLERGEKESACHEALRKACQGIAVGRYCGMKHSH
jgi:hypothetical protein